MTYSPVCRWYQSVHHIVTEPETSAELLTLDLMKIEDWAEKWYVTFQPPKTDSLIITRKLNKPAHPTLYMQNHQINEVDTHKHLGLHFHGGHGGHGGGVMSMVAGSCCSSIRTFRICLSQNWKTTRNQFGWKCLQTKLLILWQVGIDRLVALVKNSNYLENSLITLGLIIRVKSYPQPMS